ncbi:sugar ABC transporter substrate-binding protein [Promicromonospora sp. Populi]|uniref:ABC transporter substrate-binding protein n=1 Tax=Promicromonospora sp. Populi TaxID=3239420 RepID=UPI0034E24CF0
MRTRARSFLAIGGTATLLALSACGAGGAEGGDSASGTIQWWTWDEKQAVSWGKCVEPFEEANPDIDVEVKQYAWEDYWTKLTAGFVAGSAPDTFMNHTSNYPEFVDQGQLLALDDMIDGSGYDISQIGVGVDTWKYSDGGTYGLPKDWATVGFFYDKAKLTDAGLTEDDVQNMTWNPEDGGSFEHIVARLTVDENGVRGDEPGFDKDNVATYGINSLGSNGINGQDTWANFASTTGWKLGDKDSFPTTFNYADERYVQTAEYLRGLAERGLSPEEGEFTLGAAEQLGSGSVAMVSGGSWYATTFFALDAIDVGIAPSVANENGERAGLSNSNADSIWAGTQHPDAAFKWISYMGSPECQDVAGVDGTFFPSIDQSMEKTKAALLDQGIDITPYTQQFVDGTLFETPVFVGGQEMGSAISPLMEAYFTGEREEDVFAEMDELSREILAE